MRSRELDAALAAGTPSEATPALAVRARRLSALPHRRSLAGAYRRIVREARDDAARSRALVAPRRREVSAAEADFDRLVAILARPGPVSARGAAEARLLLTDGSGPLYNPHSGESLRARVISAAENLMLPPPPAGR